MRRPIRLLQLALAVTVLAATYLVWRSDSTTGDHVVTGVPTPGDTWRTSSPAPPTPAPTPTPDPRQRLAEARQALLTGDASSAAQLLGPLLDGSSPAIDADARLLLGRALLQDVRTQAALDVLTELRQRYPDTSQADAATFWSAVALDALGNHPSAAEAYVEASERYPELASYLQLRAARSLRTAGHLEAALALAEESAREAPIRRQAVAALELVRAIAQQRGDDALLLDVTSRLLSMATLPLYRAELTYVLAEALRRSGDTEAAAEAYRTVVTGTPQSAYADDALRALDSLGLAETVLREQRGLAYYYNGLYQAAVRTFSDALAVNPDSDLAWYYRARARVLAGDTLTAAGELAAMADRYPASPFTAEALLTAGKLYEHQQHWQDARAAYQRLLERFPETAQAREGRFRLGLVSYLTGDMQSARDLWSAGTQLGDSASAREWFWLGKLSAEQGDTASAAAAWRTASQLDPEGFYGLRASELLLGRVEPRMDPSPFETMTPAVAPAADGELARWFAERGSTPATSLQQLTSDPTIQRLAALLELGLRTEAGWEVDALIGRFAGDESALATLALWLDARREVAFAHRVAVRLRALNAPDALPDAVWRLLYPIPYASTLESVAREQGIDPLLLAALIRQESAFEPLARSPADARGLTQVLPSTGEGIAAALGRSGWQPDDLYRPAVSIEFGAYYLAQRLRRYDGQLYPALAGYNAGDGNVLTWIRSFGLDDPELFIERIPFPETHDYVQRVYANYLVYKRLYRSTEP